MADIQAIRDLIETERARFDVPGVGISVIIDGEVVLTEGFGSRNLATGDGVTGQTAFPIASDSKCFTAAALCILADQGALDLDAPVRTYIPWFEMWDKVATELVSARDLLSHRTGLPRHDFTWYGENELTLEDTVRHLRHLRPNKQLRQLWQYNNLCFTTAGYLTEVLTGKSWEDAIRELILEPLGMKSTGFSAHEASTGDYSLPYNRKRPEDAWEPQVLPSDTNQGPPGGIVSTPEDLSRWLLARLGKEVDGVRLFSDAALAQLHSPAMLGGTALPFDERAPMGYGLGCQIESYRGTKVVHHGGNLVGYSSDVTLSPSLNAAVAVLTNVHGTFLRDALPFMVYDLIAGRDVVQWGERLQPLEASMKANALAAVEHRDEAAAGQPPTRPIEDFVGEYEHPAYGTFAITLVDGKLDTDFHGLGDRILMHHRDRDVWDVEIVEFSLKAPVVFQTGPESEIVSLTLPIEPMVDPIVFTRKVAPITAGLLEKIPGTYSAGAIELTVTVKGDTVIAASTLGQGVKLRSKGGNEFYSPDATSLVAIFEQDASGAITQLVIHGMGVFARTD